MIITRASLKRMRKESGLTQKRLAQLVGVSQAHIAKIEQGKVDPRLSTVNKILRVLTEGEKKKCRDLMSKGVLFAKPNDSIIKVSEVMVRHAVSQTPVMNRNRVVGTVTEECIIRNLDSNIAAQKAKKIMDLPLPTVDEETSIAAIRPILERRQGVLVMRGKKVIGIITRSDLLKMITL